MAGSDAPTRRGHGGGSRRSGSGSISRSEVGAGAGAEFASVLAAEPRELPQHLGPGSELNAAACHPTDELRPPCPSAQSSSQVDPAYASPLADLEFELNLEVIRSAIGPANTFWMRTRA